ncbi:MAG: hypothetical protein ACRDMA_13915 [Solirubrobacterales bacterium]
MTVNDGTNDVARINSQTGAVTKFNLDDVTAPVGITSQGGRLWVTAPSQVARFQPGSTDATPFVLPQIDSGARHITVGPDGNLWTVSGDAIIEIPPANPTAANEDVGQIDDGKQIVSGSGNTLWATGATLLAHFNTAGTALPGTPYLFLGAGLQGIAAGPGNQVAFGNPGGSPQSIGRITPPGAAQFTNIGNLDAGFGVAFGNDGAYWITQANANNLRRFTPQAQSTFLGGLPPAPTRGPRQITKGPNNTLWVTLIPNDPMASSSRVARVTGVAPPTPPAPNCTDNTFELGKPDKNKRKGTAKLTVTVPCPGELVLEGKKVKAVTVDVEATAAGAQDQIEVKLKVKAKGKAKRKLKRSGRAKVKMDLTYTPTGGEPNTLTEKLKLKKKRR